MVAEECQSTGNIYAGSTYYSNYGGDVAIIVNIDQECIGTPSVLVNITDAFGVDQGEFVLEIGDTETFISGSEVYSVKCTNIFCSGEVNWSTFTECWFTDDGKRYVKTSGSDSELGTTWDVAWQTAGYGFQNIPAGKDLYVEEGLYGGETLSNLNPPQTMKMYIQPSEHTEAQCNVWVNDMESFSFGDISTGPTNLGITGYTYIQTDITVPYTGILSAFDMNLQVSPYGFPGGTYIFKIFRDDSTYYRYIGEGEVYVDSTAGLRTFNICNIDVQAGDLVAIYCSANNSKIKCSAATDAIRTKSGNITTDTLKSSWSTISYKMRLQAHGFK